MIRTYSDECICAIVSKNRIMFVFNTHRQDFVENFMLYTGYGNRDYFLDVNKNTSELRLSGKYQITVVEILEQTLWTGEKITIYQVDSYPIGRFDE